MNIVRPVEAIKTVEANAARHTGGAAVEFREVTKKYGEVAAVSSLDLTIEPGEFLTLLGPSGSGKSTLLMLLAGFEHPTSGSIKVAGRDLNRVPPHRRDQGVVFQSYALFPHMTVRQNLAYPLDARGVSDGDKKQMIGNALEKVRMSSFAARFPSQLSGGQQQRVALARAIVSSPPLLLMDESLSALDRNLREEMQIELKILHEELATTVVYVTHDQGEALTMSDRIAVLHNGELVQLGRPKEIYDDPANGFVARFIGESVFIPGVVAGKDGATLVLKTATGALLHVSTAKEPGMGAPVQAMVRPEAVVIAPQASAPPPGMKRMLDGTVSRSIFMGGSFRYWVDCGGLEIRCQTPSTTAHQPLETGEKVGVWIHPEDLKIVSD
ncbi:ABC transporter ATP-binding protein [Mesorhizobium sp. CAU 1732]|uniref:ABC transporter ATP-binding protein n=1 Tax=Mesorhizobium sp. CAU 1732 TaxID=3140358 RepID=UPI003260D993